MHIKSIFSVLLKLVKVVAGVVYMYWGDTLMRHFSAYLLLRVYLHGDKFVKKLSSVFSFV